MKLEVKGHYHDLDDQFTWEFKQENNAVTITYNDQVISLPYYHARALSTSLHEFLELL